MWETHGLMNRIDRANFTTICNRKLFNHCIDKRKASHVISCPLPHWGCSSDGRALALHTRGTGIDAPRISNFSKEPRNQKRKDGKLFCQTKRRYGFVRPICGRKHLKQYRACWERDWSPESPRFTSERRRREHYYTDEWIKDIRLT